MKSNRLYFIIIILSALFILAGCSRKNPETKEQNTEEQQTSGGYLDTMLNINKKAHENVKKATDLENQRLNDSLKQTAP